MSEPVSASISGASEEIDPEVDCSESGPRSTADSSDEGAELEQQDSAGRLDAIVEQLVAGERRLHQLGGEIAASDAAEARRRAVRHIASANRTAGASEPRDAEISFDHISHYSFDAELASSRHCENFIGAAQVPMGVAGPLRVLGEHVIDEDVYLPLATTEGALVASINRGCSAISAAGGATVRVEEVGMTRAPVFRTTGIVENRRFIAWVTESEDRIREVAESTSGHLKLLDIRSYAFGTTVFLRFRFESGDAMGMNMATIACDRVVHRLIEPETDVHCVALSGNYCVDKKPAAVNFQEGRGKRVHAEVVLNQEILERLKTNAAALAEVQYRKNLLGSIAAGAIGANAHFANVIAAFFLATGQDLAHVAEASMGVTCIERAPGDRDSVMVSVFLPDVPIAAIGGGTGLATQHEALALMNALPDPERPGYAVRRLAEILGAAVLAGELSLMAAFTSRDLAGAHERLGRGRTIDN